MFIRSTAGAVAIACGVGLHAAAPSSANEARSWILDGGARISFAKVARVRSPVRLSAADLPLAIEPMRTFAMAPGLSLVWQAATTRVATTGRGKHARIGGPDISRMVSAANGLHTPQLFLRLAHTLGRLGTADFVAKVIAGKFTPAFGRAWSLDAIRTGARFVDDYNLAERIGLGIEPEIRSTFFGRQVIQATAFFRDTSALSSPWIGARDRPRHTEGGVSNTGRLNSFVLSWTATDLPVLPWVDVQAAVSYQSPGAAGTVPEVGVSGSVLFEGRIGDVVFRPFVELVQLTGADGIDGKNRSYFTGVVTAKWQGWNAAIGALARRTNDLEDVTARDMILTVSAGYGFKTGPDLKVALRYRRESGDQRAFVGFLATIRCRLTPGQGSVPVTCGGSR